MANGNGLRIVDGSFDFSAGVDSSRITTVKSAANPHGLARNQLAWLENATVRGGGISPRPGMKSQVAGAHWTGIYQGGFMYEPVNGNPYLMLDIGGRTYQVRVDTDNSVHDVTGAAPRSATQDQHWFCQAEEFLLIQDSLAEIRVWDGATLRNISSMVAAPFLPTGTAMAYLNGRVTVASGGRQYLMGDIVEGPPPGGMGTINVLRATENATYPGGGGFIVPSNAGNIRGISYTANINQPVSVGTLFIGTRKAIYAFNGGTQRFPNANGDGGWANTQNLVTVAQYGNGFVNDRSLVIYNQDLFYQTLEPGVRSLIMAVRYNQQWGNTPISNNEERVLNLTDRALLRFSSGIEFNNRLYQTTLPFQTPVGVAHRGIMPLDFDLISSLEDKLQSSSFPAWEGMQEGLDFLQLFQGDFGGLQRAFAVVHSRVSGQIEVWELTLGDLRDNGDNRITYYFESPAFNFNKPFDLKQLETLELWFDRIFGKCEIDVFYRPDSWPCYIYWHTFTVCSARDCSEDPLNEAPCIYPAQNYCPQDKATATLPKPPAPCLTSNERPANLGYQFQVKILIKGNLRMRGMLLHALPVEKAPFQNITC